MLGVLKVRPNEIDDWGFYDILCAYIGRWHEADLHQRGLKHLTRWAGFIGGNFGKKRMEDVYPFYWEGQTGKINLNTLSENERKQLEEKRKKWLEEV